jgi:hypothetical protein
MSLIDSSDTDNTHSSQGDVDEIYSSENDTNNIHSSQSEADSIHSIQNDPPSEVKLIIHNQFLGIELASPMHAGESVMCYLSPKQHLDAGSTMKVYFNVDLEQNESISILMCKLKRTSINEFDEEERTCIQFVIVWKVNKFKRFFVSTYLMEHDRSRVWDRNMLMELAKKEKLFDIKHYLVEKTYLIHDNRVLKTSLNTTHEEECCKLEITISETSMEDDTQRPWYFGMDR